MLIRSGMPFRLVHLFMLADNSGFAKTFHRVLFTPRKVTGLHVPHLLPDDAVPVVVHDAARVAAVCVPGPPDLCAKKRGVWASPV